jgi:hypothetical protein
LSIIKTAIPSAEVHCLPQLNHLFQECNTCDVAEMLQLEESLNNALFKRMDAWLSLSKAARE